MNRQEMIRKISRKRSIRDYAVSDIIDDYIELCRQNLIDGEPVVMRNLIKLEVGKRNPRRGRNPKTGKVEYFPILNVIRCKPSKSLKKAINGVFETGEGEDE